MNDEQATSEPVEQETKPSLLATISLMLSLIPWAMVGQALLIDEYRLGPRWLRNFLSIDPGILILAMLVATISSIICGVMGLAAIERDKFVRGKWKAITGIVLAGCFGIFVAKNMLFSDGTPMGAREVARVPNCIANLKAISTSVTMYADDHGGQMPETLEELINGSYLPIGPTAIRCAKDKTRYVYPGSGQMWQANANVISVYCRCDHLGKRNVLFNDGRVAATYFADLKKHLAALKKSEGSADQ
jgi:prepilin-type processing-associated H-X9-DG protein